ncbi:MAG: hypothetical protein V7776_05415 [Halopseudomonas aestusnigri]
MLFQLGIIIAGYSVGIATVLILKLIGVRFAFSNAVLLILTLPLICVCITEALTLLWTHTPGSMGLGGLIVFIPMVIAGVLSVAVALGAQKWMVPFDLSNGIQNSGNLTGWLVLSAVCSAITVSLWRFWPAPVAKLF